MNYVKLINGAAVAYSLDQFRSANPRTIYGHSISDRHLNPQDVYRVRYLPKPEQVGMKAVETAGELQGKEWVVGWTLVALDEAEARALRNQLLAASDWVVSKAVDQNAQDNLGIQIPLVWLNYRQALRDITAQAGFPNNITWPTKPE